MDMGTGKTKVVLDEWGARVVAGDLDNLLVVAPAGSYMNWAVEREDEPSEVTKHLDPDLRKRVLCYTWQSGKGITHRRAGDVFLGCTDRPRVLVVNVEALSSVTAAIEMCATFLRQGRAMMAIDESTVIKTPSTVRTKKALALGQLAKARRIATGLITPRSPMDLFTQFQFLDWRILGFKSYYGFRARYAVTQKIMAGGRKVEIEVAYRNLDELQAKIAPYSYRVLKEDCTDLDPKIYLPPRDVALTTEQLRIYKDIKRYATAALDGEAHVTATAVITQILRLHQLLLGHVVDEEGVIHDVAENRLRDMMALLEEHRGKAIIWIPYEHTLLKVAAELERVYGPGSVAKFWGGNRQSRGEDEHRFKTDPKCRWMCSTQGAGGRGNTWVVADLVIYYGNTPDLEQRSQSEDRPHRIGQTKPVTYLDFIARGTVEEKLLHALRKKINMATTITGENYREWLI